MVTTAEYNFHIYPISSYTSCKILLHVFYNFFKTPSYNLIYICVSASRGSGTTTLANQERSPERLPARRGRGVPAVIANGPGRGSRGGLRSRTSGRGGSFVGGRGMRGPFRKPIETWDGCVNNTSTTQNDTNHEHNCSGRSEKS